MSLSRNTEQERHVGGTPRNRRGSEDPRMEVGWMIARLAQREMRRRGLEAADALLTETTDTAPLPARTGYAEKRPPQEGKGVRDGSGRFPVGVTHDD